MIKWFFAYRWSTKEILFISALFFLLGVAITALAAIVIADYSIGELCAKNIEAFTQVCESYK